MSWVQGRLFIAVSRLIVVKKSHMSHVNDPGQGSDLACVGQSYETLGLIKIITLTLFTTMMP